jgi:hypothetical protein
MANALKTMRNALASTARKTRFRHMRLRLRRYGERIDGTASPDGSLRFARSTERPARVNVVTAKAACASDTERICTPPTSTRKKLVLRELLMRRFQSSRRHSIPIGGEKAASFCEAGRKMEDPDGFSESAARIFADESTKDNRRQAGD